MNQFEFNDDLVLYRDGELLGINKPPGVVFSNVIAALGWADALESWAKMVQPMV